MDVSQLLNAVPGGVQSPAGRVQKESRTPVQDQQASSKANKSDANSAQLEAGNGGADARIDEQQLRQALEKMSKAVSSLNSNLEFAMDEETGIRVVKIVDKGSGEVIRQMPSKEVIEMAKSIDGMKSLIVSDKA